jgi:imidazolonepropionase
MIKKTAIQALVHASELITGKGLRAKDGRKPTESDLDRIPDGALVYSTKTVGGRTVPDQVQWAGPTSNFPKKFARAKKTDLKGSRAVVPGFVDCHTHLVFAGDRSEEFAARCAGATYAEIAARGGGILSTVNATRATTDAELEKLALERAREIASYGVRTIEAKSGYGLSAKDEIRCLKVIARVAKKLPELTIVPTFLGAHAIPKDRPRQDYMRDLIDTMLPEIATKKLAQACDIFVDDGYFTVEEARELLLKARALRLKTKIHADELGDTGSAALAASLGCLSADHLLRISDDGVRKLASSDTVAVLLPGTAFYLKAEHAPARKLIDAGAAVALSTDFNPGTCMCLSLPAIMTISALYLKMSSAEILAAVTYNGAKALGLNARKGTLEEGMDADFAVLPFRKFEETFYRFGWSPALIGR